MFDFVIFCFALFVCLFAYLSVLICFVLALFYICCFGFCLFVFQGYWLRALAFKIKQQPVLCIQDLLDCLQHAPATQHSTVLFALVPALSSVTLSKYLI